MITLLIIILVASYLAYRRVFYSSPNRKENIRNLPKGEQYEKCRPIMMELIDEIEKIPYEEVWIESFDGLKLFGRYYHVADGAPIEIQFHGYRGTAYRDFCGGTWVAKELGMNVLLVDQRANGRSEGITICFGIKEKYDCLSWAKYCVERFGDVPIVFAGVSMGAATVIMASELELPKQVKCMTADCPYSSPEDIIRSECKKTGIPPLLGMPIIKLGARIFGNLKLEGGPKKAALNSKVPIAVFHGEDDDFVPCCMSTEIFNANPKMIRLETFEGAAHGMSYILYPKRYQEHCKKFFKDAGVLK